MDFLTDSENAVTQDSLRFMRDAIRDQKRAAPNVESAMKKFRSITGPNTAAIMLVPLTADNDPTNPFAVFDDDQLCHLIVALDTDEEMWTTEEDREKTRQLQILAVAEAERRPSYLERFLGDDEPTITKGPVKGES